MYISKKKRVLKFSESINEALFISMKKNKNVLLMGLGVDDPKAIFSTTLNLNKFFSNRVFDMPTSENSMTGFAIGLAISGKRPIITHQRVEFSLLSMDQIVNQAAKWLYMNAGQKSVPLVIRLIIGRGWGQGPQHSQSLESVFSHIPGLKVVCPSDAYNAKGLLISSIEDNNPVIFFEHRWLHELSSNVPKKYYKIKIGTSRYVTRGNDITIIAFSYMVIEAIRIAKILKDNKIDAEVIDLQTLRPLDKSKFLKSSKKTKKILVIDNGWTNYGVSAEIMAIISENMKYQMYLIDRIGVLNTPIPSTEALSKFSYPNKYTIIKKIEKMFKKKIKIKKIYKAKTNYHQADKNFMGPF
jgi:pyruvate/2-oxoglutarate/acetoin dehydrogenase E1 component